MKKIGIFSIIAALFTTTACSDFLDVVPVGAVDRETLLTIEGMDMTINGMYAVMYGHSSQYFETPLSNYPWGDVMGGSANKGTTYGDQPDFTSLETYSFQTDNNYLHWKWRWTYHGVHRANVVIDMANEIEETLKAVAGQEKDHYTEIIAQARFFRGFWHFECVKHFGAAIPYIGQEEYLSYVSPDVSNVDESGNYIYIWDKIIEDLEWAYNNLPDRWTTDMGRINKWTAGAVLAKVKMYQSSAYNGKNGTRDRWSEVISLLEEIMPEKGGGGKDNNGTLFRLANTYEELWVAGESDWTGESVFDIQMAISGSTSNTNVINGGPHIAPPSALGTGGWGFYQPSYELVNSHIVDPNGLPYLNREYQDMSPLTMSTKIGTGDDAYDLPKTDLTVYTDPRLDISTGRFNTPYWDWAVPEVTSGWIRDITNGGLYMNKKNQPKKADKGSHSITTVTSSSDKNFHLIRYADVLLWYAEALIESGGSLEEARKYVNQVRARAANGYVKFLDGTTMEEASSEYVLEDLVNNTTKANAAANYRVGLWPASQFSTPDGARAALRFERKIELAMEGQRWYDLARWGIVYDEITNYISYEQRYLNKFRSSVYGRDWVTLPIPRNQIITMEGTLVQGENWRQ